VPLTPEQRRELRILFPDRPDTACRDCGGYHLRACPRVKLQEWLGEGAGSGNRVKVEYWPSGTYDDSETIYPEDVYEDEEDVHEEMDNTR
jgi:hypothetical protein